MVVSGLVDTTNSPASALASLPPSHPHHSTLLRRRADLFVLTLASFGLETASFRELGPPDLCHIIKTTGKAGQKEVCFLRNSCLRTQADTAFMTDRLLPLRLRRRRLLLRLPRRLHQLPDLHRRRDPLVVLRLVERKVALANPRRRVLLVQCVLEGGCQGGGEDSRGS